LGPGLRAVRRQLHGTDLSQSHEQLSPHGGGLAPRGELLLKSAFEHGGQIRTTAQIRRIIVERGVSTGVELEDGTQFLANKAVVSTIDTHQTFLKYVGEDELEREFIEMVKMWQWEKWSLCVQHLAMAEPRGSRGHRSIPISIGPSFTSSGTKASPDLKGHWDAMSGRAAGACSSTAAS
jgi:hypothetical protein